MVLFAATLLLVALPAALGQLLATDSLQIASFNNSFNNNTDIVYAGPGGWQEVLYQDKDSNTVTGMVWTRIHIDPCGVELPQIHVGFTELSYILEGTVVGARANSRGSGPPDNMGNHGSFPAGSVVAVAESVMHSAENPSCTEPVELLQALSGGDEYLHTDILTSMIQMAPSAVQYGMFLPNGQLQASAAAMRPIFAYNTECLARCGLAPAPAEEAAGPTPSIATGG